MRFNLGEVWINTAGRRAVVVKIDDENDRRQGTLFFADTGEEQSFILDGTDAGRTMASRHVAATNKNRERVGRVDRSKDRPAPCLPGRHGRPNQKRRRREVGSG